MTASGVVQERFYNLILDRPNQAKVLSLARNYVTEHAYEVEEEERARNPFRFPRLSRLSPDLPVPQTSCPVHLAPPSPGASPPYVPPSPQIPSPPEKSYSPESFPDDRVDEGHPDDSSIETPPCPPSPFGNLWTEEEEKRHQAAIRAEMYARNVAAKLYSPHPEPYTDAERYAIYLNIVRAVNRSEDKVPVINRDNASAIVDAGQPSSKHSKAVVTAKPSFTNAKVVDAAKTSSKHVSAVDAGKPSSKHVKAVDAAKPSFKQVKAVDDAAVAAVDASQPSASAFADVDAGQPSSTSLDAVDPIDAIINPTCCDNCSFCNEADENIPKRNFASLGLETKGAFLLLCEVCFREADNEFNSNIDEKEDESFTDNLDRFVSQHALVKARERAAGDAPFPAPSPPRYRELQLSEWDELNPYIQSWSCNRIVRAKLLYDAEVIKKMLETAQDDFLKNRSCYKPIK